VKSLSRKQVGMLVWPSRGSEMIMVSLGIEEFGVRVGADCAAGF
jgi:hypothetical protein